MSTDVRESRLRRCSVLLLVLLVALVVGVHEDYGITWDEGAQSDYGRRILRWFGSGFTDDSAATHGDLIYYGGLFEVVAELGARLTPEDRFETRHLINGLVGLLAVVAAERMGSLLGGPVAGLFSAVFLVLTPVFFGHLFNNPKDIPFAAFSSVALWAMLASWDALPRLPIRRALAIGLSIGAALGVRAGGLILFLHLLTLFVAWLFVRRNRHTVVLALAASFASIAAVAWVVMLCCWPWAQQSPLIRPLQAMTTLMQIGEAARPVLFNGRYVVSGDLPWTYVPVWFAVSLPEFYSVALLCGVALAVRARAPGEVAAAVKIVWVASVVAVPILAAVVLRPFLYDGIRHVLFVVPPLAVLAGVSAAGFLRSDLRRSVRTAVAGILVASVVLTAVDVVRLHPYQSVYFNRLFGRGVAAASQKFETDYWGSSYKEGVEWLLREYGRGGAGEVRVACTFITRPCAYYLRRGGRFAFVSLDESPNVVLSITRERMHERFRGRILHVVERLGAPLLFVIETRPPSLTSPAPSSSDR